MAIRSSFRSAKPSEMDGSSFPVWKCRPPGPEQQELERLFRDKKIDASMSADTVRKSKQMFQRFSASVFANHFRQTKAKYGLAASIPPENGNISELGCPNKNLEKSAQESEWEENHYGDDFVSNEPAISFVNPPCSTWMYTDFERKIDFVCVAVPIIAGSEDVDFTLSPDGTNLEIIYTWPRAIYDANVIFGEEIRQKKLSFTHPKVHAFCTEMVKNGFSAKSAPKGRIVVKLPCKVMRQESSWTKQAKSVGTAKFAFLEFTAFQKEIFIEEADTSLIF